LSLLYQDIYDFSGKKQEDYTNHLERTLLPYNSEHDTYVYADTILLADI